MTPESIQNRLAPSTVSVVAQAQDRRSWLALTSCIGNGLIRSTTWKRLSAQIVACLTSNYSNAGGNLSKIFDCESVLRLKVPWSWSTSVHISDSFSDIRAIVARAPGCLLMATHPQLVAVMKKVSGWTSKLPYAPAGYPVPTRAITYVGPSDRSCLSSS